MASAPKPRSNVYTVLALISMLALGSAVGALWWANNKLTGDSNPMKFVDAKAGRSPGRK